MQRLDLTHTGKFTERAEALLKAILHCDGDAELGSGIGIIPNKREQIGIMISFNDDVATVFTAHEARSLVEIITETNKEEAPYNRKVGAILDQLISDLNSLAEEAEQLSRDKVMKH